MCKNLFGQSSESYPEVSGTCLSTRGKRKEQAGLAPRTDRPNNTQHPTSKNLEKQAFLDMKS